jgi:glycosyltransferase involved in cell wall biosynthesis
MIETWAVIPTRGRPQVFHACLDSIIEQVDGVVVIDNNDQQAVFGVQRMTVIHHPEQPPNLSKMINMGIDEITKRVTGDEWNVVLLNDDVTVPPGWVDMLSSHLRAGPYAAAYNGHGVNGVMTCWACVVRGELGLRWDEDLRWWYGDNAFDLMCRDNGGIRHVLDEPFPVHHHPDQQTYQSTVLSRMAHEDGETFARKYGR